MDNNQKITTLQKLIDQAEKIDEYVRENPDFKAWKILVERTLSKIFGDNSIEINEFRKLLFYKHMVSQEIGRDYFPEHQRAFGMDLQAAIKSFKYYIEEFSGESHYIATIEDKGIVSLSDEIFIVHGHDEEMKQSVARTLEKLNLKPIILHEKPNKGRTVIQKFTDHSDVSFAIVLLSPDDIAYPKADPSKTESRARQNVIFEMGFFMGKLGQDKVIAIYKSDENFEILSDYKGVLYIQYDTNGTWKTDLVKELKAAGYNVSADDII